MKDNSLSAQLDEARRQEEYYRTLLVFWKKRRQRLENQIPIDDPFGEFLGELFNDDNYRDKGKPG